MSEEQEHRVDHAMSLVRSAATVFIVVSIVAALAVWAVFWRLGEIVATQEAGVVRGYKNRTPMCVALLLSSQSRLPDVCTEAEVLPYVCQAAAQTNPAWVPRIEEQVGHKCAYPEA